jgi:4,5-DOPA dioxygenase extradiol
MNAIETNDYTRSLARLAGELPRPKAILCVSAHWMTEGSWITRMPQPKTIHDFYGFPKALSEVRYPAPGSPEVADEIRVAVSDPPIQGDDEMWGLDHGTWAVLKHMYPQADVPTLQLSIYMAQPPQYHYLLGQRLKTLRERGILIVGSGNIVHNLRKIRWETDAEPYDWAIEFDEWVRERLERREHKALVEEATESAAGKLSVPTPDHYYPLLYALGASDEGDELRFEYEGIQNASISMRCLRLG